MVVQKVMTAVKWFNETPPGKLNIYDLFNPCRFIKEILILSPASPAEVFLDTIDVLELYNKLKHSALKPFCSIFIPGSEETLNTDRRGQAGDAGVISWTPDISGWK